MAEDYIQGIKGLGKKKRIQEASGIQHAGALKKPAQLQQFQPRQPRGDQVNFSDEVKEPQKGKTVNLDALKQNISDIKSQLGAKPSGKDASAGLVNDALTVQMEKNGLQAAKPPVENLGMKSGIHAGATIGAKGIQGGIKAGMKTGGVYSSKKVNDVGHNPGGGKATPNMVKMETNYAGALKNGHKISGEAEDLVLRNMANSGIGAHPIKHMMGMT